MADLYRKSSLEKLSNPEQLDRRIKISSPLSWVALIAVLLIIVVTVVWSIVGTLPTTETVNGMIVNTVGIKSVQADTSGTLTSYYAEPGDKISKGQKVAEITMSDNTKKYITADIDGVLSEFLIPNENPVSAGTEVARITPDNLGTQAIVCYVPITSAQKFKEGMEVLVYPTSIDSQKYGHMEAEVVSVDDYAASVTSMTYVLGNDIVAQQFAGQSAVVAVVCKIKTDDSTKSGFYWTSNKADDLTVNNGTVVSSKIVVDECAPITKLIGKLKDILEG